MKLEQRFAELYIDLPEQLFQVSGAVSVVSQMGKFAHVDGCLPYAEAKLAAKGRVPTDVRLDVAKLAAKQCFIQAFGALRKDLGSLDSVKRLVRYELFVQTELSFADHAKIAEGVSDLIKELFGKDAKHSRSVVGVASLPQNAAVMLNIVVEVK